MLFFFHLIIKFIIYVCCCVFHSLAHISWDPSFGIRAQVCAKESSPEGEAPVKEKLVGDGEQVSCHARSCDELYTQLEELYLQVKSRCREMVMQIQCRSWHLIVVLFRWCADEEMKPWWWQSRWFSHVAEKFDTEEVIRNFFPGGATVGFCSPWSVCSW